MRRYLNEKILAYKIRKGDAEAFGEVYDYYNERIYRFVFLKLPTTQDAEDITAEVFLKAWRYIREQKSIQSLQAFLYQIARTSVVDFYRKKGTEPESLDDQEIIIADRTDLTLQEKMALKSELEAVEVALRQLKDSYREVVVLHYLNELSVKEIAAVIGQSPGTTRVILHRGIKALKNILSKNKP